MKISATRFALAVSLSIFAEYGMTHITSIYQNTRVRFVVFWELTMLKRTMLALVGAAAIGVGVAGSAKAGAVIDQPLPEPPQAVPEPATALAIVGAGGAAIALRKKLSA